MQRHYDSLLSLCKEASEIKRASIEMTEGDLRMEDYLCALLSIQDRLRDSHHRELRSNTVLFALLLASLTAKRFPQLNWWVHDVILEIHHDFLEESIFSNWIALKCLRSLQSLGYLIQGDRYLIDASCLYKVLTRPEQFDSRCVYYSFALFSSCSNLLESQVSIQSITLFLSDEMVKQIEADDILLDLYMNQKISPRLQEPSSTSVTEFQRLWANLLETITKEPSTYLANCKRILKFGCCWLPVEPTNDISSSAISLTDTTTKNLDYVAKAILMSKPAIIQGENGSGKISLIKEIARVMGYHDKLVTLQLNDQSDGRSLLGAYVCTDVPGEFKWQAGILTQAALQGYWLVIQDIDKVPLDIIAMMSSLLEFRTLYLPQRKYPIQAHPHFRILATRSTSVLHLSTHGESVAVDVSHQFSIPHMRNFAYLWYYVDIQPLSGEEIEIILRDRFPTIPQLYLKKILHLVSGVDRSSAMLSSGGINSAVVGHRGTVSLTKALKIAQRLHRYSSLHGKSFTAMNARSSGELYVTDRLKYFFFQDFIDIFCADARHEDQFVKSVHMLGQFLGMPSSEIDHVLFHHTIDIVKSEHTIQMGRCLIKDLAKEHQFHVHGNNVSFAETKYAKKLLEKILVCVEMHEPVLLVGETGTGKTTVVQQLATIFHRELIVQNLSLSTDAGDLLGGFRPATIRDTLLPLYEDFVRLFQETMSSAKNADFLTIVANFFQQRKWQKLLQSFLKGCKSAINKLESALSKHSMDSEGAFVSSLRVKLNEWHTLEESVTKYQYNLPKLENGFAFRVVKGLLVQAFEKGQWILLDEINLAPPETIQLLSRFLTAQEDTITVEMNGGDLTTIKRHPNFRVFAAMNPPTDVCKRELAAITRNKFTELYIEEMTNREDLITMVQSYLGNDHISYCADVVDVYLGCRAAAEIHLTDGSGQKPRFSLRSLTRALKSSLRFYQMGMKPMGRCLFEGFLLSFHTCLSSKSKKSMYATLLSSFYSDGKGKNEEEEAKKLDFPCAKPKSINKDQQWIQAKPFWIEQGHHQEPIDWASPDAAGVASFVGTKTVLKFIRILSSAVAASVAPILLQGPTSIGKTTVIQYLAAKLGYHCVRINNHEHTDVQEYIGGYVTGTDGKMLFQDGLLVQALRNGYWIILDELNLAPSEVLEALNRLLDDNKELLIPETGEIIKPTKGFQLFATQNPPGIYGGRKPLSLAFRNRFIEVDLDDIPPKEMEQIITTRCGIAPKFATMMVKVCEELQIQRQQSNFLLGKEGSITMRDLLKWGNRSPQNPQEVAQFGYMLLCEKLRSPDEKGLVRKLLAKICKLSSAAVSGLKDKDKPELIMSDDVLYGNIDALLKVKEIIRKSRADKIEGVAEGIEDIAITRAFNRMWHLLSAALDHSEPVLLVGDTGAGKTMACQLYAALNHRPIRILNCHQTTETADIIGSLRPVRGRQQLLATATEQLTTLMDECLTSSLLSPSEMLSTLSSCGVNCKRKRREIKTANAIAEYEDGGKSDEEEAHNFEQLRSTLFESWSAQLSLVAADPASLDQQPWLDQLRQLLLVIQSKIVSPLDQEAEASEANQQSVETSQENHKKKKRKTASSENTSTMVSPTVSAPPIYAEVKKWLKNIAHIQRLLQKSEALFEWIDGPLVESMREGAIFVLDEINLAEDAVIERLNSVLEYKGELTLAEKGGEEDEIDETVVVSDNKPHRRSKSSITIKPHPSFRIIATMNPSGDFGKRELSPALRSRLTEVWIPNSLTFDERALLVATYLHLPKSLASSLETVSLKVAQLIVRFTSWIQEKLMQQFNISLVISNREIISWTKFVNAMIEKVLSLPSSSSSMDSESTVKEMIYANVIHGAYLIMLDGLSMLQGMTTEVVNEIRLESLSLLLSECVNINNGNDLDGIARIQASVQSLITVDKKYPLKVLHTDSYFTVGYFSTTLGPSVQASTVSSNATNHHSYIFETPKVTLNVGRILRAMQIGRPILLEGPPGVGKTSLITNLAKQTGHHLVRINLSEQTELSDLLGSDLPTVPTAADFEESTDVQPKKHQAKFKWYDGIFLTAMKEGHWVLLDELNLAPQTVLEGLNACFDHRGQVFLPEIGQTVHCSPYFRIFAAQNPLREGGGRKGLPASFLSRFTKVVFDALSEEDLISIMSHHHEKIEESKKDALEAMHSTMDVGGKDASMSLSSTDTSAVPRFNKEMISKMVRVTHRLNEAAISGVTMFGHEGSPWEFNLRDVMRWCDITTSLATNRCRFEQKEMIMIQYTDIIRSAFYLFGKRLRNVQDRIFVRNIVLDVFGSQYSACVVDEDSYHSFSHAIEQDSVSHSNVFRAFQLSNSMSQVQLASHFEDGNIDFTLLRMCVQLHLPVLVVGPQGSGRKAPIIALAKEYGRTLRYFAAFPSLDSTEMLGAYGQTTWEALVQEAVLALEDLVTRFMATKVFGNNSSPRNRTHTLLTEEDEDHIIAIAKEICEINYHINTSFSSKNVAEHPLVVSQLATMYDHFAALIERIPSEVVGFYQTRLQQLKKAIRELQQREHATIGSTSEGARFQWEDGAVVSAIQSGEWLLFDHVNLAPASVLDRLNSLLEPQGSLLLTEDGSGRHIHPHPDFRVFFVMDPVFGEISRAMRNRCVEMFHDFSAASLSTPPPTAGLSLQANGSLLHAHQMQLWLRKNILNSFSIQENSSQSQHLIEMLHSLASLFVDGNKSTLSGLESAIEKILLVKGKEIKNFDNSEFSTHISLPLLMKSILITLYLQENEHTLQILQDLVQDHFDHLPQYAGSFRFERMMENSDLRVLFTETMSNMKNYGITRSTKDKLVKENFLLFVLAVLTTFPYGMAQKDHILALFLSPSQYHQYSAFKKWIKQAQGSFQSLQQANEDSISSKHLLWLRLSTSFYEWQVTSTVEGDNLSDLSKFMSGETSVTLLQLGYLMSMKLLSPSSLVLLLVREVSGLLSQANTIVDCQIQQSIQLSAVTSRVWTDILRARALLVKFLISYRLSISGVISTDDGAHVASFPAAALVVIIQNLQTHMEKLVNNDVSWWFKTVWKYLYQLWDGSEGQSESHFQKINSSLVEIERPRSVPTTMSAFQIAQQAFNVLNRLRGIEFLSNSSDTNKNVTMIMPFRGKEQKKLQQEVLRLLSTYRMLGMKDTLSVMTSSEQEGKMLERSSMILKVLKTLLTRVSAAQGNDKKKNSLREKTLLSLEDIRQEVAIKEFSERETFLLSNTVIQDSLKQERQRHILSPLAVHIGRILEGKCAQSTALLSTIAQTSVDTLLELKHNLLRVVRNLLSDVLSGMMGLVNMDAEALASLQLILWLVDCILQNDAAFPAVSAHILLQSIAQSVINELDVLKRDISKFVLTFTNDSCVYENARREYTDFSILELYILEQQAILKNPRAEAMFDALMNKMMNHCQFNDLTLHSLCIIRLSSSAMNDLINSYSSLVSFGKGVFLNDQSSLRKKFALDFFGQVSSLAQEKNNFMDSVLLPEITKLVSRMLIIINAVCFALPSPVQKALRMIDYSKLHVDEPLLVLNNVLEVLKACNVEDFQLNEAVYIMFSIVIPTMQSLQNCLQDHSASHAEQETAMLEVVATAMWRIHHLRFTLCMPASPLDPSHLESWRVRLFAQEAHEISAHFTAGITMRAMAGYPLVDQLIVSLGEDALFLQKEIEQIQERVFIRKSIKNSSELEESWQHNVDNEEEKSAFEELYSVLRNACVSGIFEQESMQALIIGLTTKNSSMTKIDQKAVEARVSNWLSNAESMVLMLRNKFSPTYNDFIVPLISAIDGMMIAMQYLYAVFTLRYMPTHKDIATSHVMNTNLSIRQQLQQQYLPSLVLSPVTNINKKIKKHHYLYMQLEQISVLWRQGLLSRETIKSMVYPLYTQFVQVFLKEERDNKKAALAKASMYKIKTDEEDDTDEKRAERAFRQQFPNHLAEFQKYLQPIDQNNNDREEEEEDDDDAMNADEDHANEHLHGGKLTEDVNMIMHILSSHLHLVLSEPSHTGNKKSHGSGEYLMQETKALVNEHRALLGTHDMMGSSAGKYVEVQKQNHHALEMAAGLYWHMGFQQQYHEKYANDHSSDDEYEVMQDNEPSINVYPKKVAFSAKINGKKSKKQQELSHLQDAPIDRDLEYLLNPFPYSDEENSNLSDNDVHCPRNIEDVGSFTQEIAAALPPLHAVLRAVRRLLQQFPGNEILFKILRLCLQITATPVTQLSLSKMLVQYQVLLQVLQEWEQVAARHVSLASEMKKVTSMIIRWRRLEYASWTSLLRKAEIMQTQQASQHWFSLMKTFRVDIPQLLERYRKVKMSELNIDSTRFTWWEESAQKEYSSETASQAISQQLPEDICTFLSSLVKTMDTFLRTSTVGEFPTRLHLVRVMSLMLYDENANHNSFHSNMTVRTYVYRHICQLLVGIWQYFSQFLPIVRRFQDLLRQPLTERVKNEVKFGKWDDLNAYALLENSEKVHRKLHKIVQEYEKEVLSTAVSMLIERELTKNLVNEAGELIPAVEIPPDAQLYPLVISHNNNNKSDVASDPKTEEYLEHFIDTSLFFETLSKSKSAKNADITSANMEALVMARNNVPLPQTLQKLTSYTKKMKNYFLEMLDVTYLLSGSDNESEQNDDENGHHMPENSVNYALQAADLCESMVQEVFDRVESLRGSDVMKNMKWKAVRDMIETLQEHGFSALQSVLPAEIRDNAAVLSHTGYVPILLAKDLQYLSVASAVSRNVFEKGEFYHQRNLLELWQLRMQSTSVHSPDVSHRDVLTMLHLSESMLVHALRLRHHLSESLQDHIHLLQAQNTFQSILQHASTSSVTHLDNVTTANHLIQGYEEADMRVRVVLRYFLRLLMMLRTLQDGSSMYNQHTSNIAQQDMEDKEDDLGCDLPPREILLSFSTEDIAEGVSLVQSIVELLMSAISMSHLHVSTSSPALYSMRQAQTLLHAVRIVKSHANVEQIVQHLPHLLKKVSEVNQLLNGNTVSYQTNVVSLLQLLVGKHRFDDILDNLARVAGTPNLSQNMISNFSASQDDDEICRLMVACVDATRLSVQRLLAATPAQRTSKDARAVTAMEINDVQDKSTVENKNRAFPLTTYFKHAIDTIHSAISLSSLSTSLSKLNSFLLDIPVSKLRVYSSLLVSVQEMLAMLHAANQALVDQHILAYKSFTKLSYIVIRVFRNLVAKGICSQEAKEDSDNNGDSVGNPGDMRFEDDVDGTGMGEGDGKKDVSNEIENEEQLLGTKDQNLKDMDEQDKQEEKKKDKLDKDEKDTGVEMTQDFEGDMFDLPSEDEEEEKENRRNEEEEKDDDEEELDREMGDADDEDIVDERQWDSDDEEDDKNDQEKNKDKKEKFEQDSKMKGEAMEDEMHTKDNEEDEEDETAEAGEEVNDKEEKVPKKLPNEENDTEDNNGDQVNEEEEKMERPRGVKAKELQEESDEEDGDNDNEVNAEDEDGEGDEEGEDKALPMDDGDDKDGGKDGEEELEGEDLPENMQLDGGDEADNEEDVENAPEEDVQDRDGVLGEEIEKEEEEEGEEDNNNGEEEQANDVDGNMPEEPPKMDNDQEEKPTLDKKNKDQQDKQKKQPLTHGIHDEKGADNILKQPMEGDDNEKDAEKDIGGGGDEDNDENDTDENHVQDQQSDPQTQKQQQKKSSASSSASGGDDKDNKRQQQQQQQASSSKKAQPPPKQPQQPREKNPFLQMGDIEKDWHRRLNIVDSDDEEDNNRHLQQSDDEDDNDTSAKNKQDVYEFAKQEEASKNLSQVLAGSDKDTAKQLPQSGEIPDMDEHETDEVDKNDLHEEKNKDDLKLFDDNKETKDEEGRNQKPTYREDNTAEDHTREERKRDREVDEKDHSNDEKYEQPQRKKPRKEDENRSAMDVDGQNLSNMDDEEEDIDNQIMEKQKRDKSKAVSAATPLELKQKPVHTCQQFVFGAKHSTLESSNQGDNNTDNDNIVSNTATSTTKQNHLLALSASETQEARLRWQTYRTQTESHALRLSETLRLILAPTLATRLQGDYRTGKRINMRKVIPYIASGYRKDKIWLRRTKPAKRAYQIMLMIDDSRSMGQSTAGQLAMSSLALLSTALVRLEVGEMCISSFAKELNVIHPFGKPFTEDVGTQVAAHFHFDAEETNVSESLQSTIPVFQQAKDSLLSGSATNSSDTAVLQICFLLSDARVDTDNRQRLEQIVRTMSEQHILVVLVIIDCNEDARDSIFQTKSIKFTSDQQIVTTHYFDDFPFPYYVAIQEVGKLPDVLADALKQWFELIKLQLNNQASGA